MDKKELEKEILAIKESIEEYVGPIYVAGDIDLAIDRENTTCISLLAGKDEFAILNNKIPRWVKEVNDKKEKDNNLLIISDIDKIDIEYQDLLLDIVRDNKISTIDLPENLKIILNSKTKCVLSNKLHSIIECYDISR